MIFYLLKDGRMSELEKEDFFLELSRSAEPLVYAVDEESIDIIKKSDAKEYDFSHLLAVIELNGDHENIEEIIGELQKANIFED